MQKRYFARKSKLWEKIRHFEKIKKLFSLIERLGFKLRYKQVSGSKIITQPLQVKLDVFAVFWESDFHQLSLQ